MSSYHIEETSACFIRYYRGRKFTTEGHTMFVVRDGSRQLKFDGEKLSESSSRSRGRTRWVEFQLYRTSGNQYVLARIGVSLYYHSSKCEVVARNKIQGVPTEEVSTAMVPCETCSPVPMDEETLFPEEPRFWALIAAEASSVVDSLYKFDDRGSRYMTNVARRLLEDAARIDDDLHGSYYEEIVD
jgi:hypothetical protein